MQPYSTLPAPAWRAEAWFGAASATDHRRLLDETRRLTCIIESQSQAHEIILAVAQARSRARSALDRCGAACPLTDEQETNAATLRSVVFRSQSDPGCSLIPGLPSSSPVACVKFCKGLG